jgi:MFS-type transporter involved in bile tolerance (Atg22 family)
MAALAPEVKLREVWAWSMYDFANSAYTTVVITAVFGAYFVGGVAQGKPWATFAWTAALLLVKQFWTQRSYVACAHFSLNDMVV